MSDNGSESDGPAPPRALRVLFVSLPRALIAVLLLTGVAINFANVVSRYLFDFALYWAEEIMIFLIVWCVFIGAIAVAFNGANLRMDLISARIASPWKEVVNGLAALAFVVCGGFVVVQSFEVVTLFHGAGQVSVAAGVPMTIPHAALLVGFVFMVLAVLVRLRAYFLDRF